MRAAADEESIMRSEEEAVEAASTAPADFPRMRMLSPAAAPPCMTSLKARRLLLTVMLRWQTPLMTSSTLSLLAPALSKPCPFTSRIWSPRRRPTSAALEPFSTLGVIEWVVVHSRTFARYTGTSEEIHYVEVQHKIHRGLHCTVLALEFAKLSALSIKRLSKSFDSTGVNLSCLRTTIR